MGSEMCIRDRSKKSELISRIDQMSFKIESQARRLIAEKTGEINNLESKSIPSEFTETSLIGIPFYIALFKSPKKVRAEIYPPMVARSYTSTLQRIKRIFSFTLESRMEILLNPRFPELDREIFMNLKKRVRSNTPFRKMIFEAGISNNLLESSKFASSIVEEIGQLESEGWISPDERRKIIEMYAGG